MAAVSQSFDTLSPPGTVDGRENPVDVNLRALIDKVLARYSGEFTLFRELLQNSDDAESSTVEIHFETARDAKQGDLLARPAILDVEPINVVQWTFRNNGKIFDEEDWVRLPRIAEGNPSPEKIGGFGVGFYSLFSVTDSPVVTSGENEMTFFWKENGQLCVRRRSLSQQHPWTIFKIPLREPGPLPVLDFMRFLASSITFMTNLKAVNVFLDDEHIGSVKKSLEPSQAVCIPDDTERLSPRRIMHVQEVRSSHITIEAEINNAVFACSQVTDTLSLKTSKLIVDLQIFIAKVQVTLDGKDEQELHRCTKKKLPSQLNYNLVYTGRDEQNSSFVGPPNYRPKVEDIFQGLKHPRIFIGHATSQTTGVGGHMASRFIPTVERESIDFVEKYVSIWNKELLYVGGFLCRVVYELELSDIERQRKAPNSSFPDSDRSSPTGDHMNRRFVHILNFFSFHNSTPSLKVSQILRESFYECSTSILRLLSSAGVRKAPDIRMFDPQVAKFLDSIPMLSEYVNREGKHIINALPERHRIPLVAVEDVLRALKRHPLDEEKLVFCLKWWLELRRNDSSLQVTELLNAVTYGVNEIPLSRTEYFIDTNGLGAHIPPDGPLPGSLIPSVVSKCFTPADLMSFGWREFTVLNWLQHISRPEIRLEDSSHDFTRSPAWAQGVLFVISHAWASLLDEERSEVLAVLEDEKCIPTSDGLHRPRESYLTPENDNLFHKFGLPVVTLTESELSKEMRLFLSFIGISTHVPLQLLSQQMLDTGEWCISDFVKYLVQRSPPLTMQQDLELKACKIFSEECSRDEVGIKSRCSVDELYPPVEIFRRLHLPVIQWDKSEWSNESAEAKLLYRVGLRHHPPLSTIIELCTSVGESAFTYFCDNLRSKYSKYDSKNYQRVAFVPAKNKEEGICLKCPEDVYSSTQWETVGFSVIRNVLWRAACGDLGIKHHPLPSELLHLLDTSPPSNENARQWYECLSECIQNFTRDERVRLSELRIVPVPANASLDSSKWVTPTECYLGPPPAGEFYSKLFIFVDFGTKANSFLSNCGTMKSPSPKDIAETLIRDPDRFCELAGKHEGFLDKLRDLATQRAHIPNDTLNRMSQRRTLLGRQRRKKADNQDEWELVHDLRKPKEIFIVDDSRDYALFSNSIYVAPEDELLKRFYSAIGCRRLSTVIEEECEYSTITDAGSCSEIRTSILKRLPSFLKQCSHYEYDQTRVPSDKNFSVMAYEGLTVTKTLIVGGDNNVQKQDVWAVIGCSKEGHIVLCLSQRGKQDIFDLAASLCKLLFGEVRTSDSLLLGAILSDSELLKRTWFDVDRFSEKESPKVSVDIPTNDCAIRTNGTPLSTTFAFSQGPPPQSAGYIRGIITNTANNLCNAYRVVNGRPALTSRPLITLVHKNLPRQVIPQSYMRDIVNKATEACRSRNGQVIGDKDPITGFLRHHSCNDFAQVGHLQPLGVTPQGVQVHVAGGVPDICAFIAGKQELLARFIDIIAPVASAHKLSMDSLHVFYDIGAGSIGCNVEGSIYLNLRYFEEWHDEDVRTGHSRRAHLSWFFVLAHEIAHNLIPLHDSAHEFWFSAICEDRIDDLFAAMGPEP